MLYQDLVDLRRSSGLVQPIDDTASRLTSWTEKTQGALDTLDSCLSHNEEGLQLLRRTCYAYYEGELYIAFIVDIYDNEVPPKISVEYIGWGNKETVSLQDVKFVPPTVLTNQFCRPGSHCWAIKASDGLWHTATISQVNSNNLVVQFTTTNETVTLPLDWVSLNRPMACIACTSTASRNPRDGKRSKRPSREIITPGGYRIPDALRINPQDTERVRQIKKKKISLLKKEQRREVIEQEARNRQTSWKTHTAATAKKNKSFVKKESIFTTSHAPDAKVGVTGSGKGMTHFVTRSKHIFREDNDEDP